MAKWMLKFIKERTGMHTPAKRKQEELSHVLAAVRKLPLSPPQ